MQFLVVVAHVGHDYYAWMAKNQSPLWDKKHSKLQISVVSVGQMFWKVMLGYSISIKYFHVIHLKFHFKNLFVLQSSRYKISVENVVPTASGSK